MIQSRNNASWYNNIKLFGANFRMVDKNSQQFSSAFTMFASDPCVRHASRAWALNDLACMGTTRNASENKGVLHTLEADCPEASCGQPLCKTPQEFDTRTFQTERTDLKLEPQPSFKVCSAQRQ